MPEITVSPNGMLMLDGVEMSRADPRLWGRAGRNITGDQGIDPTAGANYDSRYYYQNGVLPGSEGGGGGDPTFAMRPELAERLNGRVQVGQGGVGGPGELIDPSKLEYDPELGFLTTPDNIKPTDDGWDDRMNLGMMIAAGGVMGGAALAHGAAAGAAGSGGAALGGGGTGGVGAGGSSLAAMEGAGAGGGGLASLGAESLGGGGVLEAGGAGGIGAGGGAGSAGITGGGAVGGSNLLSNLGGAQNVARLGMGLASLGSSGGGGGGGGSGPTDANSIIEQMARANRVNHTTPLGSRRWTQGPDGQWSVTDSMDPMELANFQNVQGMNADVTGMARQRLAALLASPPRQRYDRPLGT